MTWAEFNDLVRIHLHVHNRRQGIQTLIDTLIKAAVLDLQSALPYLRVRTVPLTTIVSDGFAGVISVPAQSTIVDLTVADPVEPTRWMHPTRVPVARIPDLRLGQIASSEHVFAYDPVAGKLWLCPDPSVEGSTVRLEYETLSAEYADSATVPFDARVAQAVAEFVLTRLTQDVDKDPALSAAHGNGYRLRKRQLYSDAVSANQTPDF